MRSNKYFSSASFSFLTKDLFVKYKMYLHYRTVTAICMLAITASAPSKEIVMHRLQDDLLLAPGR